MLVLSKLTNINHASGGSYDPPLFLYSALFPARGRFGGASLPGGGLWRAAPPGGGLWRGFPARRRLWRGFPARRRRFGAAVPPGGDALAGCPARRRGLARLPCPAAALWRGFPARLFLPARYIRLWADSFFRCFSHTRPACAKASAKFCRLHCRISYCIGKFQKFVKTNE